MINFILHRLFKLITPTSQASPQLSRVVQFRIVVSQSKRRCKTSTPGVNFTNILRAAFTREDPKIAKELLNLIVFFALLGSLCKKAARRTLVKLTTARRPRSSRFSIEKSSWPNVAGGTVGQIPAIGPVVTTKRQVGSLTGWDDAKNRGL